MRRQSRKTSPTASAQADDDEVSIESGETPAKREQQLMLYQQTWEHYSRQFDAPVTVLMQCGVFFNWIGLEDADGHEWNNLREVSRLLNLKVSPYSATKPASKTNPLRCGIKWEASESHQTMLLDEGYVLVIMMQTDPHDSSVKEVTDVLTRGTRFSEVESTSSNNMVTLYIENNHPKKQVVRPDRLSLSIGMCAIDLSTGGVVLHSATSTKNYEAEALDEAYRFAKANNATEVMVLCRGFEKLDEGQLRVFKANLEHHLELDSFYLRGIRIDDERSKQCSSLQRQTQMLEDVIYADNPDALHHLDMYPLCRTAFTACAEIINEGRPHVLQGLLKPEIWDSQTQLVLTHNAIGQLDMMSRGRGKTASLLKLLDHTSTGMGRRLLERWLSSPLIDPEEIRLRLDTVEQLLSLSDDDFRELRGKMDNIGVDVVRLLRKAELSNPHGFLGPAGLHKLYQGVQSITELFQWFGEHMEGEEGGSGALDLVLDWMPPEDVADGVTEMLDRIEATFDLSLMANVYSVPSVAKDAHLQRIFLPNVKENVDAVIARVDEADKKITSTAEMIGKLLHPTLPKAKYQNKVKIYKGDDSMYFKVTAKLDIVLLKHYIEQAKKAARRRKKKGKMIVRWWDNGADYKKNGRNEQDSDEESNSDEEGEFQEFVQQFAAPGASASQPRHRVLPDEYVDLLAEMTTSECGHLKVFLPRCDEWYLTIKNATNLMHDAVVAAFNEFVAEMVDKYQPALEELVKSVAAIDVLMCFARASKRFNYHKPECVGETFDQVKGLPSFLHATELRHPIVERVLEGVEYIPNDLKIGLTDEGEGCKTGVLLFGTNNSGKSVLLKSAALAIVMAQAGCYVPATTFRFMPFHSIITRLSGKDNMRGGQGTFAVEMTELRTILSRATPKSLVLGDEICRGTEYPSAVNIVASSIVELLEMETNFIFATHLHSLSAREDICDHPRLDFQHFHVETVLHGTETQIIYNRKLRPGSGPATYGIEVAAAQGIPQRVIERAHQMRREMMGEAQSIVDTRTSHFNAKVVLDRCAIPDCKRKAVHAHHIRFQSEADEAGVIDGRYHKNSDFNLVGLCEEHHDEVHHGNLEIKRWAVTLGGRRLLITAFRKEEEEEEMVRETSVSKAWGRKKK